MQPRESLLIGNEKKNPTSGAMICVFAVEKRTTAGRAHLLALYLGLGQSSQTDPAAESSKVHQRVAYQLYLIIDHDVVTENYIAWLDLYILKQLNHWVATAASATINIKPDANKWNDFARVMPLRR